MIEVLPTTLHQIRFVHTTKGHIRQLRLLLLDLQKPSLYCIFDDKFYGCHGPGLTKTVLKYDRL